VKTKKTVTIKAYLLNSFLLKHENVPEADVYFPVRSITLFVPAFLFLGSI